MQKQRMSEKSVYHSNFSTFALPNNSALNLVYDVYKTSRQTIRLLSEQGRTVFPEVFIENSRLGPLRELCTAELARSFGPYPLPIVLEDPLLLIKHYDTLDVELPLAKCYEINDERFWKRVVLAKYKDKMLALKSNINWKNLGVSLKYVELVEVCAVEYWREEEMKDLALKVKEFITEMHIKHLESLSDRSFEKNFQTESEEESKIGGHSEYSGTTSIEEETKDIEKRKTTPQLELEVAMAYKKENKDREAKDVKRKRRKVKRAAKKKLEKNPYKKKPDVAFDIEVSDSDKNRVDSIVAKCKKALLLNRIKKYNYPDRDCHHVDLKFLQYFTNLEIFTIEFWGPIQNHNFHKKHMKFSYDDIKNLSIGLSHLTQLKVFRLRNSSMDADKIRTLCCSLAKLPNLETLDFGYDQLEDDCCLVFEELFKLTVSLKNLELETNFFNYQTLLGIGKGLENYNANTLSYLGLARNPITDKALHVLVSAVIGTKHIEYLNIKGVTLVTEMGLCCYIANELLSKHPTLIKLNLSAIKISPRAADEIIRSLDKNEAILEFNCSACELDERIEVDINVILKRNKYISENWYLGDSSVTIEEVTKWFNSTRNPVLLKVFAEIESNKECLRNFPAEPNILNHLNSLGISHHTSADFKLVTYDRDLEKEDSSQAIPTATAEALPFTYPANDFDEQQFLEHVHQPGPRERYYDFKMYKKKYVRVFNKTH